MKQIQFKTNIMCDSCIAKVTPLLNETFGEMNWEIDIKNPKKILTVSIENINENDIINTIKQTGYKAEKLN